MKRLQDKQVVGLGLGSHTIECRVVAVARDEAALAPVGLERRLELPEFRTQATLRFEHADVPVLLKGEVRRGHAVDDLRFAVSDGVQVRQARRAARLRMELPTTVGGVPTTTLDLATRGLCVRLGGEPFGAIGDRRPVRLLLPGHEPFEAEATIVRETDAACALEFGLLPRAERDRLDAFIYAQQRRLALAG